jgi:hypothetical protein
MQRLARVNRTQAFLGALALVVLGLFAPGWFGAAVLLALVIALLLVMVRTAAATRTGTLLVRVVILACLVVIAVTKVI